MGSLPQILSQAMSDYQAGRLQNAERLYHEALAIYPEHPDALNMLGVIAMRTGRSSMAGELFQRAINATPGISQYHGNLGLALARQGRLEEAIAAYRKSLSLKPDYADSYNNLGNALLATGSVSEAVDAFMAAIKHRPDFVEAHSNLGSALQKLGKVDEGVAEYRKAIALNPNYAQAHNNLANGLRDLGKIDGACAELRTAMRLAPGNTAIGSNYVYTMSYHPATGSEDLCRAERQWNQQHAAPLSKLIANHSNERNPDRKLRIGYISGDFRDHIAGKMILPLLLHRNREQFEVLCYYNGVQSDETTAKFRAQSDGFRSIVG
ncbi:MAG: tetratricopeptide repeat protein, partial [Tepidisphaeraceae bacterium]